MPLLIPVITILMLLMIAPCIINCLIHFVCPGQQATTTNASSTRIYKTTPDHSPQMDTAIRTLRIETSKRGKHNAPCHPSSAGSSQRDLDSPTSKELGLLSLDGGMLGSQNRKKRVQNGGGGRTMKGEAPKNGTKEGPKTRVKTSGEANSSPVQPNLHRVGSEEEENIQKEEPKLSPSLLFSLPACLEGVFSFAFQIKLSCNQAVTLVCCFKFSLQ